MDTTKVNQAAWTRMFAVLADMPRQDRERERELNGMSSQESEPMWSDPIGGQSRFDREFAERTLAEMGIVLDSRVALCECCNTRRPSGRDENGKMVCATCCPYGTLNPL